MKKCLLPIVPLIVLFACGCAKSPESISPSYISEMSYMGWNCEQLAQEQPRLIAALASVSDEQRRCRENDAAGIIFLGLPVASLSGSNMAPEVGRLKGELQALQRAAASKNCSPPPPGAQTFPPIEAPRASTAISDREK